MIIEIRKENKIMEITYKAIGRFQSIMRKMEDVDLEDVII